MTHNQAWTRLHRLATVLESLAAQPGEWFHLESAEFSKQVLDALAGMQLVPRLRFEPDKDWAVQVSLDLEHDA